MGKRYMNRGDMTDCGVWDRIKDVLFALGNKVGDLGWCITNSCATGSDFFLLPAAFSCLGRDSNSTQQADPRERDAGEIEGQTQHAGRGRLEPNKNNKRSPYEEQISTMPQSYVASPAPSVWSSCLGDAHGIHKWLTLTSAMCRKEGGGFNTGIVPQNLQQMFSLSWQLYLLKVFKTPLKVPRSQ